MRRWVLILVLLIVCNLALTGFVLRQKTALARTESRSGLSVMMGDGRRLFANHFLSKADAYFHRGRYPSIFEMAEREQENHLVESLGEPETEEHHDEGHAEDHQGELGHSEEHEHDDSCDHARPDQGPDDWLSRLAARFKPDSHVHLEQGDEKEMLPWVKLAVEMDPHDISAYTVGGYWLRQLGSPGEAESFLREGQRNNPDSYEIYFELGRLKELEGGDSRGVARLYEIAIDKWHLADQKGEKPDDLALARILGRLGHVLEESGDLEGAVRTYTTLKQVSPSPDAIQVLIDSARARMGGVSPVQNR